MTASSQFTTDLRTSMSTTNACTVPTFNFCTKCPGIIHDCAPNCHSVSWAWMLGWQFNWMYLSFPSYVGYWCSWPNIIALSMGVCTTGHLQTSGRLVQELNVYTICDNAIPNLECGALKVLQYTGGHDLFSIGRRRSPAVSTADIPLVSQGTFFQHIHASEPEHWPAYNLVIRAIVKIFKRELLVEIN